MGNPNPGWLIQRNSDNLYLQITGMDAGAPTPAWTADPTTAAVFLIEPDDPAAVAGESDVVLVSAAVS